MAGDRDQNLPGLDVVGEFLRANVDPHIGECVGQVIAGGKSNMTYLVGDGRHQWIVRRPPLGHVLETAHDMGREARVMSALAPTAVPVPRVLAVCNDPGPIGAPFYVMEYVPGTAFRDQDELRDLGAVRTREIADEMTDVRTSTRSTRRRWVSAISAAPRASSAGSCPGGPDSSRRPAHVS